MLDCTEQLELGQGRQAITSRLSADHCDRIDVNQLGTEAGCDGRKLWGNAKTDRLEPRADLTSVTVEHHNQLRHPDRRGAALEYYRTRDRHGIEELPADRSILADAA